MQIALSLNDNTLHLDVNDMEKMILKKVGNISGLNPTTYIITVYNSNIFCFLNNLPAFIAGDEVENFVNQNALNKTQLDLNFLTSVYREDRDNFENAVRYLLSSKWVIETFQAIKNAEYTTSKGEEIKTKEDLNKSETETT